MGNSCNIIILTCMEKLLLKLQCRLLRIKTRS